MLDAIFILLLNALFFFAITAAATLLLLPLVKLFRRPKKREKMEYAEDCAGC